LTMSLRVDVSNSTSSSSWVRSRGCCPIVPSSVEAPPAYVRRTTLLARSGQLRRRAPRSPASRSTLASQLSRDEDQDHRTAR
jgi:hypothetical protein